MELFVAVAGGQFTYLHREVEETTLTMVVVGEIVTAATGSFALFKGLKTIYCLGKKVMSNKWKDKLKKYKDYQRGVEQLVRRYKKSKRGKTSITAAVKPLEGALKESRSICRNWDKKICLWKRLTSHNFMKKLESSQNSIARSLELLVAADRMCGREETRTKVKKTNHENPQQRKEGNLALSRTRMKVQKKKEPETETEREENEYKDWLKKNIAKWTDAWSSYKTVWEGATNSKLDLAERERLFENHVNALRKRAYRQLLKEVIKPDSESKYLEMWSHAESLLSRRQRFGLLPEREREIEWRRHADQILKKNAQTVKGTSGEKGK